MFGVESRVARESGVEGAESSEGVWGAMLVDVVAIEGWWHRL